MASSNTTSSREAARTTFSLSSHVRGFPLAVPLMRLRKTMIRSPSFPYSDTKQANAPSSFEVGLSLVGMFPQITQSNQIFSSASRDQHAGNFTTKRPSGAEEASGS